MKQPNEGIDDPAGAAARGQVLKLRIAPSARLSGKVRREVRSFADGFHLAREELDDFILAVGEAVANAIEHSRTNDVIEVRCQIETDKILATIVDSGAGFAGAAASSAVLPDELAERGRGLPIMRRCVDIFAVHSVPGRGTAVVLGCYLRPKPGTQETGLAS